MTFERELMAALCLAVVWVHTLLISARALGDVRRLRALRRRLVPARPGQVGLLVGRPVHHPYSSKEPAVAGAFGQQLESRVPLQGQGTEPGLHYRLVQTARTRGDGKLYFHDRQHESRIDGGQFFVAPERVEGQRERLVSVEATPNESAWVWPDSREVKRKLECPSVESFDELARAAMGARGAERALQLNLLEGDRLHVVGLLSEDGARVQAPPTGPLIVSAGDPRRWLARKVFLAVAVITGILLTASALTALAFWPPAFGTVGKVGAMGLLLHFLLVQPLGVWLAERVQFPHEAAFNGVWARSRVLSPSTMIPSPSGAATSEAETGSGLVT